MSRRSAGSVRAPSCARLVLVLVLVLVLMLAILLLMLALALWESLTRR